MMSQSHVNYISLSVTHPFCMHKSIWQEHLHTYDMYMHRIVATVHVHVHAHIHTYTLIPATHTSIHTSIQYAHHCFLFYRAVGVLCKRSTILLTEPAEVGHWLHDNNVWQKLPPQPCEGGIAHRSHGTLCRRLLVELPHLVLGCAAGEKLDVSTLIPGTRPGSTIAFASV